ncbi:MAG TPA: exo-alpha-sialidase [Opitutus sp.]|nr:exo-alpha-sialidase [Opitutus sp.]
MKLSPVAFLVLACCARASVGWSAPSDTPTVFTPVVSKLASPAGADSLGATLATGPDHTLYLSWTEPTTQGRAVKFSRLDRATKQWSAARTIVEAADLERSSANAPHLVAQANGRLTAVWSVTNPAAPAAGSPAAHDHGEHAAHMHNDDARHAMYRQSADGGATWNAPQPLTRESEATAFPSLAVLPDGRVLAAWLDGRGKQAPGDSQKLYARILGAAGPDTLVDPRVCECCQTTLTVFPDGSVLLAYRGRTDEEIRDIMATRFSDERWEAPQRLSRDRWKINACPINGPQLDSDGPRVSAAWFTAADNEPRVLVSSSPSAGDLYTMPARVDLGHALGRVDTLILRDGAQLVSWLEGPGDDPSQPAGLYLRRYASFGATLAPALITPSALKSLVGGFPRMALLKDYDDTAAQLVIAFTRDGDTSQVETLLVTLPDAAVLAAADSSCGCAPSGEQLVGYPIRGKITAIAAGNGTLRLQHVALPGVMRAGEREFKVAPNALAGLQAGAGREVLARVEQRSDGWWIFDVKFLGAPVR